MSARLPLTRLASVFKRFALAGGRSDFVAVDDILIEPHGDRLETAIGRVDCGGDDPATRLLETEAAAVDRPPRRRVGGLPLPGKTKPRTGDLAPERTVRWVCRFPVPDERLGAANAVARCGESGAPARRAGGLPMPGKSAPKRRVPSPIGVDVPSPTDARGRVEPGSRRREPAHV